MAEAQAEVKKPDWPQTPDGTIDWETVFEDPKTGIIPALSAANNKDALHKGTVAVIRQLFTRKNDEIQVERFLKELTVIVGEVQGSEDFPKMQEAILNLLRRIKDGRVEKAAAHVANQKKEAAQDAKRKRKKKKDLARRAGEAEKQKAKTLLMIAGAGGLILVLGVLAIFLFVGGEDEIAEEPVEEEKPRVTEFGNQPKTADETKYEPQEMQSYANVTGLEFSEEGYPLGKVGPEDIKKLGDVIIVLAPIPWSRNVGTGNSALTVLLPVLTIGDNDLWSEICEQAPALNEAIILALERVMPQSGEISPDQMRRGGQAAMQLINKRLGAAWVDDLYVLHDVDRTMYDVRDGCQIVPD